MVSGVSTLEVANDNKNASAGRGAVRLTLDEVEVSGGAYLEVGANVTIETSRLRSPASSADGPVSAVAFAQGSRLALAPNSTLDVRGHLVATLRGEVLGSATTNLTVANGSTLELSSPMALRSLTVASGAQVVGRSVALDVSGDMWISAGAAVSANARGALGGSPGHNNATGEGPGGSGSLGGSGGGHGGRGLSGISALEMEALVDYSYNNQVAGGWGVGDGE